jgi:hypothetical protein
MNRRGRGDDGGTGSQKRSNEENGGIGKEKLVFFVSFVSSVAPFLRSGTLIYLRRLEAQLTVTGN